MPEAHFPVGGGGGGSGVRDLDFNVLFIHLSTRKIPFNAHVFTLRYKVELNWTRAI